MSLRVLLPENVADDGKNFLIDHGYEIVMGTATTVGVIKREIASCHAVLARSGRFPAEVLEAAPELRVVARHGVGYDSVDVERAAELGIWVTNTPQALSATVAEHAIGLLITVARHYIAADAMTRQGRFADHDQLEGIDIEGKTLGIVGFGRIGSTVAAKASAGLGMQILACDPYVTEVPPGVTLTDLPNLLTMSDFVSLHIPSNPETAGLIGSAQLAQMKPTAYLINTARGTVLDEAALVAALQQHTIAGAAVDVYDPEPPLADNPLFTLENVVLTPHIASMTRECMNRMALHAAQGIHEVLSGGKPTWPVNTPTKPRT